MQVAKRQEKKENKNLWNNITYSVEENEIIDFHV